MKVRFFSILCVCVLALAVGEQPNAGQASDSNANGGFNVSVDLRHRVVIPQVLYFRIGGTGIEKLSYRVTAGATGTGNNQSYSGTVPPPVGDGTPIAAGSGGVLPVSIYGNIGNVNLSYDLSDSLGLSDGNGNHIPFDEIDVTSANAAGLPAPPLENAGANNSIGVTINGNLFGGRVIRQDTTWTFTYANSTLPLAGTYTGRVRYTVSSP